MPAFDFLCPNGHTFEEIVLADAIPNTLPCVCGGTAKRQTVYRTAVVGPVWSDLERFEYALLSPKERASGARFRTARDIERHEAKLGIVRQEDGREGQNAMRDLREEGEEITRIRNADGSAAARESFERRDIMDVTGWTTPQYLEWKRGTEEVQRAVTTGRIPVPDAPPAGG